MILVTGATGYIGSHLCLELVRRGEEIFMVDDGSNSGFNVYNAINNMAVALNKPRPRYKCVDVTRAGLGSVPLNAQVESIFHLAGVKSLAESFVKPSAYFTTNVGGTAKVLETYKNCKRFVFSSSAAVYAPSSSSGVFTEKSLTGPLSPYGQSKLMAEQVIEAHAQAHPLTFKYAALRYFNPVGVDASGVLKEAPKGPPNNLMPYLARVATGEFPFLTVYGNDYDTPDGTAVRDYIHITDLVDAHLAAHAALAPNPSFTLNLGSGKGLSVTEMTSLYSQASGLNLPVRYAPRRLGDLPTLLANASKAKRLIGWAPKFDAAAMCRDSWNSVKPKI